MAGKIHPIISPHRQHPTASYSAHHYGFQTTSRHAQPQTGMAGLHMSMMFLPALPLVVGPAHCPQCWDASSMTSSAAFCRVVLCGQKKIRKSPPP